MFIILTFVTIIHRMIINITLNASPAPTWAYKWWIYSLSKVTRQDSSLVAWLTRRLGYRVWVPLRPISFFGAHICSDPNCSNSWDNNDNRTHNRFAPHKKRTKKKEIKMTNMSKLTCKRSIKPFKNLLTISTMRVMRETYIIINNNKFPIISNFCNNTFLYSR